jgi:hypothetical protein
MKESSQERTRFGIGEWYGKLLVGLSPSERQHFAKIQKLKKKEKPIIPCPFRPGNPCSKEGGVCSIRMYRQNVSTKEVSVAEGRTGSLRTTCPHRFLQDEFIFKWIGRELLGYDSPVLVREVGFLRRSGAEAQPSSREDVGRIDMVLVDPTSEPFSWCALEMQAVYFSGAKMGMEFAALSESTKKDLTFPEGHRRPDYRSSGPKRLMPQLQIKVPTLRRWGRKMAVVVDESFFNALGEMDFVDDVSNCDIGWFVVGYEEARDRAKLVPEYVRYTTLEKAVEGLTGGKPVTKEEFEFRIREKLAR